MENPPNATPKPTRIQRILAYRRLWVCAFAVFALDLLTKLWIARLLPRTYSHGSHGHIEVIPGFFNIVHVGNTGAAWSILEGRATLLALVAVAALVMIFFFRHTLGLRRRWTQIAFGLLCGGIAGNLLDRLRHADGHVVDFLDFRFGSYAYPAFNIADAGICVGVAMYVLITLFTRAPEQKK